VTGAWCRVVVAVIVLVVFIVAQWSSLQDPLPGPLPSDAEGLGLTQDDHDERPPEPTPGVRRLLDHGATMVLIDPVKDAAPGRTGAGAEAAGSEVRRGLWFVRLIVAGPGPGVRLWPVSLEGCPGAG
jgi:hypothetical protein